jgi:hypothetical protein
MVRTVIIGRGCDRGCIAPTAAPLRPRLGARRTRAFILLLAALFTILLGAACALRTLRVARDLRRCELDYRRWG